MSGLVSVIIPCRNERKAIERTVRAICASDYEKIEVIIVDGMSDDGTRDIIHTLMMQDPRVKMIDNPKKLTPYAFNIGIVHARGEYIQIVGSRNVMAPDYLSLLIKTLKERPEVACVGGDYQHVANSPEGEVIALAMESKFGVGAGNYRTMRIDAFVDTVGVPMYRSSIFRDVGFFDERLTRNQDDEFNFRLRERGLKIFYVHNAKVTYLVRGSLKKAFHQFSQYGYFKVFVNQLHGTVTTMRQVVPAAFLGFWVVLAPLIAIIEPLRPLLGFAILLYVLTGLSMAGRRVGLIKRFKVLFACFVLHIGYGYGYWVGIWDFMISKREPRLSFQGQTT